MSRKSLILCLVALAVLVAGTGLAVAFLYSGMEDDGKGKTSQVADEDRYLLFPAVPSDAVLVASFPKRDLAVSMHYSGKLTALYVYDAGKASEIPSDKAVSIMEDARAKGLVAEYVDCSQMEGVGGRLSGRALVVASASDRLVESSVRHLSKSVSVLDAPGFADASKAALGSDLLFVSHAASANLVPVVMNKAYKGYAGFMSRLADWTVFSIDAADERFTLSGSAVYGGGASDFMTVLEQSVPSESSLSSVLPSYTRFAASLPLGDAGSYMQAYRQYLDSRNLLQKNASLKKALGSRLGITPDEFMKQLDVREVAIASFMSGSQLDTVCLMRTGAGDVSLLFKGTDVKPGKNYVPAVHSWPYAGFASSVFGDLFSLKDESCFTWVDGWIVSGSMTAVEEYVSGRALDYTLAEYMADASQEDLLARDKTSFVSYFSFSEAEGALKDIFAPAFLDLVCELHEGAEYCPAVLSVSKGKRGLTVRADVLKLALQKTKAPAFERDTTVVVPEGPFEVKNSGTGKMDRFYQNSHLSLCLSEDGKDLWGVPFKKPLCGTAHNVDYYANGKLQIIFGAGSEIYLIDRLGRYVTGFPVSLGKDILVGPDIYDFNGTRKYNIMVLHKDNTIEMYNLKGQKPASWKGITAEETIKGLPERIVVEGNSYWVVRTSIQTLIYPFYGGEPLSKFSGDQMIRPDSPVTAAEGASVQVMCYDGKQRAVALK